MKTNRNARFVIDFVKKTITGSEASFKKAGKGKGLEYDELTEKIAKHPDFKLVVIEAKKSTKAKRTYDGLNYKFMEEYFLTQTTAVELTKEYNNVRKMAKETGRKEFPFTKKWFLDKFSTEDNPFDMEEAKAKIEEVLYAKAAAKCIESIKAVATEIQQEAEPAKVA